MQKNNKKANKGEWSELYAFIRLLKEGKLYAADENVNRIENIFFPIIKIIREDVKDDVIEYNTGDIIKIFKNNELIQEIDSLELKDLTQTLYSQIFDGTKEKEKKGAFEISEINTFMEKMYISKIKAPSGEKGDMTIQVYDINTGYSPIVRFSVKSDIGSPPTLLNAAKNTRVRFEVKGINAKQAKEINEIDKSVDKNYMIHRISKLFKISTDIVFDSYRDETFKENLIMIDSLLPEIYANMILLHYKYIAEGISDCESLVEVLKIKNPLKYKRTENYDFKIRKFFCAVALGMVPGKAWDGKESATGGYIIIKKDGDVVCYHLYNRNYFEEYLIRNTQFDRPSASKHDYAYLYEEGGKLYIDLNIQIRFRGINARHSIPKQKRKNEFIQRILTYYKS